MCNRYILDCSHSIAVTLKAHFSEEFYNRSIELMDVEITQLFLNFYVSDDFKILIRACTIDNDAAAYLIFKRERKSKIAVNINEIGHERKIQVQKEIDPKRYVYKTFPVNTTAQSNGYKKKRAGTCIFEDKEVYPRLFLEGDIHKKINSVAEVFVH